MFRGDEGVCICVDSRWHKGGKVFGKKISVSDFFAGGGGVKVEKWKLGFLHV